MPERIITKQFTGSGALAETITCAEAWELVQADLNVTVAPTTAENLVITKDAAAGAAYDSLILSEDMAGTTDYILADDPPMKLAAGDQVDFNWTNTDGRTWGLTVFYRVL